MSRKSKIESELRAGLAKYIRFGIKKGEVKDTARAAYLKGEGKVDDFTHPKGLFSRKSYETYCSDISTFSNWASKNTNAKAARSARQYVHKYLKELIDRKLSPYTIKKYAHALARAYDCEVKDFGVDLPIRKSADIKRSRNEVKSDKRFRKEIYESVREFARGTGARIGGLETLRACDIRPRDGGGYEVFLDEKGGKKRWARVLPQYEKIVLERFNYAKAQGEKAPLFSEKELEHHIDVHACRREYAKMAYAQYLKEEYETGELYRCRKERYGEVYDKGVLMAVSRDLGHNRCNVVVTHYLG